MKKNTPKIHPLAIVPLDHHAKNLTGIPVTNIHTKRHEIRQRENDDAPRSELQRKTQPE